MTKRLVLTSVLLGVCTAAFAQGGVEKTLMEMERQWVKAALASNGGAVAPMLHTNFVMVQSDGTMVGKAQYVAQTNKAKWQVSDVSDMKVQVYGDSAIVTGLWTGKGTDGAGKAFDGKERFADTWVKMPDAKWQCVSSASALTK